MIYDIGLVIEYDYRRASASARNVLRLLPLTLASEQLLISGLVAVDPVPDERSDRTDYFGNAVTEVAFHAPLEHLSVTLRARVERTGLPPEFDLSPPLSGLAAERAALRSIDPQAPHHFLAASDRVAPDAAMRAFARDHLRTGMTVFQAVIQIGEALHTEMRFDADATDVETPPSEAFAKRHGVCQDFSHVMIGCLRSIGIPCGYVSGFLRTIPPAGEPRLEGTDAMHAWVRAWCGLENGWVQYDPTNRQLVGTDHIVVAYGRDYSDVAPVKGILRTSGAQDSRHSVDVVPLPA